MNDSILRLQGIYKFFNGVAVLKNVDFDLRKGEVHAIVGENGAGKSTLMKILMGVYKPEKGKYMLRGKEVNFLNPSEAQNNGVAMVFQEFSLINSLTVAENIMIGKLPLKKWKLVDWEETLNTAKKCLEVLDSNIPPNEVVKNLSAAQKQEVEIARAISYNPDILIMDEPTSALSLKEINRLQELIGILKAKNVAIIYVSHKLEEILTIADRVTIIRDGVVIDTVDISNLTPSSLVQLITGKEISGVRRNKTCENGARQDYKVLELKNFTAKGWVHDINLTLYKGEITGVAGLIGSGKTELAKAIFGALPRKTKYKGEYYFCSSQVEPRENDPQKSIKRGICFLTENRREEGIIPAKDLSFNLTLTILKRISKFSFISSKIERKIVKDMINTLNIRPADPFKQISLFSGGNQQKILLGKWIVAEPKLLILDEPTRGVDVGARKEIYDFIRRIAKNGTSVLVFSSDLKEILEISDRILVMKKGTIIKEVMAHTVSEEELLNFVMGNLHQNASA